MTTHWEVFAFVVLMLALFVACVISVIVEWIKDRRKWRQVKPYYGKPYDASSPGVRPNIRRVS